MNFERIVEFTPAYDRRNTEPSKNYGIHGVELRMVLKGEKGAVQFVLFTNWNLPNVTEEMLSKPVFDPIDLKVRFLPMPADVGYHSPKAMYEGQEPMGARDPKMVVENMERAMKDVLVDHGEWPNIVGADAEPQWNPPYMTDRGLTGTFDPCPYLDGKPCYYDGSGLAAEDMFKILVQEGSDGVWKALEERYNEQFLNDEKEVAADAA